MTLHTVQPGPGRHFRPCGTVEIPDGEEVFALAFSDGEGTTAGGPLLLVTVRTTTDMQNRRVLAIDPVQRQVLGPVGAVSRHVANPCLIAASGSLVAVSGGDAVFMFRRLSGAIDSTAWKLLHVVGPDLPRFNKFCAPMSIRFSADGTALAVVARTQQSGPFRLERVTLCRSLAGTFIKVFDDRPRLVDVVQDGRLWVAATGEEPRTEEEPHPRDYRWLAPMFGSGIIARRPAGVHVFHAPDDVHVFQVHDEALMDSMSPGRVAWMSVCARARQERRLSSLSTRTSRTSRKRVRVTACTRA